MFPWHRHVNQHVRKFGTCVQSRFMNINQASPLFGSCLRPCYHVGDYMQVNLIIVPQNICPVHCSQVQVIVSSPDLPSTLHTTLLSFLEEGLGTRLVQVECTPICLRASAESQEQQPRLTTIFNTDNLFQEIGQIIGKPTCSRYRLTKLLTILFFLVCLFKFILYRFQTQACEQYLYGAQESRSQHVREKSAVNPASREMFPSQEKCKWPHSQSLVFRVWQRKVSLWYAWTVG